MKAEELYIGFDLGTSSVQYAVCRKEPAEDGFRAEVEYAPGPVMHFSDISGTLRRVWSSILSRFRQDSIISTGFTGTGAAVLSELYDGLLFEYDSVAVPKGVQTVDPAARYIFHIGAKDPYFFHLRKSGEDTVIQEWAAGSKCGGGSGILLEKQCRRMFEDEADTEPLPESGEEDVLCAVPEEQKRIIRMFRMAEREASEAGECEEFLARCGVVIQSDLIHEQNIGTSRQINCSRLFRTVARNYVNDVIPNIEFPEKCRAVGTGGVLSSGCIKSHLEEYLGIPVLRPAHFRSVGAVGAAVRCMEESNTFVLNPDKLEHAGGIQRQKRACAPPLADSLSRVHEHSEPVRHREQGPGTRAVLGIDGGSTTTKGVLVDTETGALLDKVYLKTHGDPESSLKKTVKHFIRHRENVDIVGTAATGSARRFYEKLLMSSGLREKLRAEGMKCVDEVPDEITCHAVGVKYHNSDIDTIFEIGGQDMKFTTFRTDENGPADTVERAEMNYSCQAGSGQTMENLASVIDLDVEGSLQEYALKAERVPVIDSTCGVFMEMDVNRLIGEGFTREEIAAAIVRATAASYYYKFVGGSRHVGRKCSAQGGPALGKAFLAALAQVSSVDIYAFPHREVFGAWGAALAVCRNIQKCEQKGEPFGTAFRGWDIIDLKLEKKRVSCSDLFPETSCTKRDCTLEVFSFGSDTVVTGGFCPVGNSERAEKPRTDYVRVFHKLLEKHFRKYGVVQQDAEPSGTPDRGPTIGIKRCTATLGEKGIWSAALFSHLGFVPVLSPVSNDEIAKTGVNRSQTDFCFARKLATGHALHLYRDPAVEYLFNPSFISYLHKGFKERKFCIYTESEGYVLNDALSLDKRYQINPIINFGDLNILSESLRVELKRIGFGFSLRKIRKAVKYAEECERLFEKDIAEAGDLFLKRIEERKCRAFVGIGRDYVILDPKASSDSGAMISQIRGLHYIPQIFLKHRFTDIPITGLVEREYWEQSVLIMKCSLFTADHPLLFPIRMLNFGCGPDSMKLYQEEKIFESASKPLLTLLTDAQTNNAPFVTRMEAHEKVVEKSRPGRVIPERVSVLRRSKQEDIMDREWLIPYMGDDSYIGSAVLHHFQIDSRVVPTDTREGREIANKHIHTEVCYPLKGVVGDVLGFLARETQKHGIEYVNGKYLVMLPTAGGPCRYGKYRELLRLFMDEEGFRSVPIEGPSSEQDYTDLPLPRGVKSVSHREIMKLFYRGIYAADILEDLTLRFRPYARVSDDVHDLKRRKLEELCACISQGGSLASLERWGEETVRAFKRVDLVQEERLPLVLYMGEIYMRHHDPYTDFVIHLLEEKGLEVIRSPVYEWLHYINAMQNIRQKRMLRVSMRSLRLKDALSSYGAWLGSLARSRYMDYIEHRIEKPFYHLINGRHSASPRPIDIINELENGHHYHSSIEGESPLSIGLAYFFMKDRLVHNRENGSYISGIFHVGPFTCMQEGVATAKIDVMIKEYRKQRKDLLVPIIHAFFGDSPNPNLEAEIAVFREQCYQKQNQLIQSVHPLTANSKQHIRS